MASKHPHAPPFIQAPNLMPFSKLLHGISTRHGGVSTGPYRSLNLSFDVGDSQERVLQNYHLVSRMLHFDLNSLVACQQVHHNAIAVIDESYLNQECFHPAKVVPATDGLATNVPGITLLTRYADCVPLLFFNPERQAAAIAHAGWKGTLARIGPLMVDLLSVQFKCSPARTLVMIGPSIGPCCYSVSSSMADLAATKLPPAEHCFASATNGQPTFDLWHANKKQLIAAGINEKNIFSSDRCTSCNTDLFFSYRKEAKVTGRFGAFIGIKRQAGS